MKKALLILNALVLNFIILINNFINIFPVEAHNSSQFLSLSPMLNKTMPAVVSILAEGYISSTTNYTNESNYQQQHLYNNLLHHVNKFNSKYLLELQDNKENEDEENHNPKFFQILGSGVIVNAEKGYIVTNNHVVNDANKIEVKLSDNSHYDAKLIGQDIQSDIAVLQLKNVKNLTVMQMADSDKLRIGDYAIAIGNPYGLGESATYGIISGLGRTGLSDYSYQSFIQTDASINRGNSGGALVNLKGELIGINTAIFTPDGGNSGIGFAIPSNTVKETVKQIIDYGQVKHIDLGIIGTDIDLKMARIMNFDRSFGIFVNRTMATSTATRFGIKSGDIITSINNQPIKSLASLYNKIGLLPIGTVIKISLLRNGKFINLSVKLDRVDLNILDSSIISINIEGAALTNGESYDHGVYVDEVIPESSAARIGLKNGDIILGINNKLINNIGDLRRVFNDQHSFLIFNIKRNNKNINLFSM
ncbi:serine endoprotease [Candidatus Pantoea edessiphila]|uniref:Serine endoprotease n=1 Tax=Candidatus Pantoea edessiphila TaxID=2044610 RepID=A0A2P5T080_9GAMM|nr:Do family serine endopeptidase [Candidatus Pantoea edessiphila]PPI87994.1 serine endoprotease [Candidatus Pantoea edessiphila]